jgi:arsenate reductase
MHMDLQTFIVSRLSEFDQIDTQRQAQLNELANYIAQCNQAGRPARLNFVCTHNSRRSHLAQLLSAAAGMFTGVELETYSSGTEATAFNPRAVAAIERAGFGVKKTTDDENPLYEVTLDAQGPAMVCFSKRIDDAPNPTENFAAIMVCDSADAACPSVPGAERRFAIRYVDPKEADDTPQEAQRYDERCMQIAREMLYTMTRVKAIQA